MKPCTSSFTGLPETLTALPARQIQLRLNSYNDSTYRSKS
jgi:hypothetical protein